MRERLGVEDPEKVWRPLFQEYNQTLKGLRYVLRPLVSRERLSLLLSYPLHLLPWRLVVLTVTETVSSSTDSSQAFIWSSTPALDDAHCCTRGM